MRPIRTVFVAVVFVAVVLTGPAFAHTTERAFVLILPTELYVTGGTLVVALSFVLIAHAVNRQIPMSHPQCRPREYRHPA